MLDQNKVMTYSKRREKPVSRYHFIKKNTFCNNNNNNNRYFAKLIYIRQNTENEKLPTGEGDMKLHRQLCKNPDLAVRQPIFL